MKGKLLCAIGAVLLAACSISPVKKRVPAGLHSELETHFQTIGYGNKMIRVRIGIQNPVGTPIGDVLFLHGFADRLDNHEPLFEAWTDAGLRVISFDLPSHGENSGPDNNLNHFNFEALSELTAEVEQETKSSENRPLLLAGWSTGGLIVTRLLQKTWTSHFSRPIGGAILFAPGVSVRKFPWTFGNRLGEVTEATLTHDPHPPHVGPIQPDSPFWSKLIVGFAPKLVLNSVLSQTECYPLDMKTLVFSGGDTEDMYAKSWVVRAWVEDQNIQRNEKGQSGIISISCPHSMHEMDNELPEYGGIEVRKTAAEFAREVATGHAAPFFEAKDRPFGGVCSRIDR